MSVERDRGYSFLVEWYDHQSQNLKSFAMTYYPTDSSVELWDIKAKRMFLKRCRYEGIRMQDLFVGSTVTVFHRQLNIVDYGNGWTRDVLGAAKERTLGIVLANSVQDAGKVLDVAMDEGFALGGFKMVRLNQRQALQFLGSAASDALLSQLTSGPVIAMDIVARKSVQAWRALIEMRAWTGFVYGSATEAQAQKDLDFFFGANAASLETSPSLKDTTLCLIKPHTLREGSAGRILRSIQDSGFSITAANMFHLDRPAVDEFLEVYQGVLPAVEYSAMCEELGSGRMIAVELAASAAASTDANTGKRLSSVNAFRRLCGPYAVHIAKEIRPDSIRAQFGKTVGENAVHCTDMEGDNVIECEYFFSILPSF